ncbi:MAG: winged helix-turn-helix domain-containing protein [Bacteroidales bacterium]|nr:winged helix-turn-helix domain-containing protein [Bacteroidales bacterium]
MKKYNHAALKYQVLAMLQQKGILTPSELTEKLADFFGLDEHERNESYEGRPNDKVFYKSVATNEQHLKAAGLMDFLRNGCHCITQSGLQALQDNKATLKIEYAYLRQFPEYCEWSKSHHKKSATHDWIEDLLQL